MQAYHYRHGGESINHIFTRVNKHIKKILNLNYHQRVIIISHADPLMTLIYGVVDKDPEKYLLKKRLQIPMGGIAKITYINTKLSNFSQLNY